MPERTTLVVLFGGRSVEHEVSIRSARSVLGAADPARYDLLPVAVDPDGRWFTSPNPLGVLDPAAPQGPRSPARLVPEPDGALAIGQGSGARKIRKAFFLPLIHGFGGEDGSLQGLFELADVPYAGSGVLASALAFDKARCKTVLRQQGLPVLDWSCVTRHEWDRDRQGTIDRVVEGWTGALFVKPSNGGSSVGVCRVDAPGELPAAVEQALELDAVALVEPAVDAREIEVAILGNDEARATGPGEIVPARDFYDYRAKYEDSATRLLVPAPVDDALADRLRELALGAFAAVEGAGLARVDFLVERADGTPWISEINTLPGFTDVSMYPRLWEADGVPYTELIDHIVALGRARYDNKTKLRRRLGDRPRDDRVV